MRNHMTDLGDSTLIKDDDRQKWSTLFHNTNSKTCHHNTSETRLQGSNLPVAPFCSLIIQSVSLTTQSHWQHVWGMMKCKGSRRKKPYAKWRTILEIAWRERGQTYKPQNADIPAKIQTGPSQIQVYSTAATSACLVSSGVHTLVMYM